MHDSSVCCGRRHRSPYCPKCGRQLREIDPLEDLLEHCEQQARAHSTLSLRHQQVCRNFRSQGLVRDVRAVKAGAVAEREANHAARWQEFAEVLAQVIEARRSGLMPVLPEAPVVEEEALELADDAPFEAGPAPDPMRRRRKAS